MYVPVSSLVRLHIAFQYLPTNLIKKNISVTLRLRDTFLSFGVYMIYIFLKWNDYNMVDSQAHTWTPLQGRTCCPSCWECCSYLPLLSAPSGTASVAKSISPQVIFLPMRDECRSTGAWPSHLNSERPFQIQSSPQGLPRLSLSLHPSLISLCSLLLPSLLFLSTEPRGTL